MIKNYEKGELAKEILIGLAAGGFIVACLAMPGLTKIVPLFKPRGAKDRYRINQAFSKLHKKKLIKIYTKNGNEVVEITMVGKKIVLEYNLDGMKLKISKKWDGWWRIVMFDIPQSKKRARDAVSRKIKELGMYPIQKSVFVSPYVCKNEIDFIGEFFGVRGNIIYIKAKDIEGARKLKEYFHLP
jgi:DNA-binding transcriptional regulator PaaX